MIGKRLKNSSCILKNWSYLNSNSVVINLKKEGINKVSLIAFKSNTVGNAFWKKVGWLFREDLNYYDFNLNENNITKFIE